MADTTITFLVGAGLGFDPFATSGRWPNRMHPRRDDAGHDGGDGGKVDAGDQADGDDGKADDEKQVDDAELGEGGKKALDSERAARKEAERKLAALEKAQEKAAEDARLAKLSDDEKRDELSKAAAERADKAEAALAIERAARKHGLTDDKDLELLDGLPADKVDAIAKRIAAEKKPAGRSGNEVDGGKPKPKPTTLSGAIAAHYS